MTDLHPIDRNLLFTKNDKEDPRLGECVQLFEKSDLNSLSSLAYDFAILGYADDEGIALNGGRIGAHAAPEKIRHYLYRMTPHLEAKKLPQLLDFGNLSAANGKSLQERHETGRHIVKALAKTGHAWISLGGGHDYGYCDSTAFAETYRDQAVVINFDAHMDVRPTDKGFNSGTPFYRLLSEFAGHVDFAEVGIQNQCNSRFHIEWAKKHGASVFSLDQIHEQGLQSVLQHFLKGKEKKKIFLSIDMDAFSSNEAPGCSQSWTTGFFAQDFLPVLQWLIKNYQVSGMGLYEVSPPLDQDHRTSKLAALLAHHFIFSTLNRT
ncbi:MAG TPA: formimidoylglutamase [Bdellovibrio sp.]|nr:formimidoylglutamase [Bdellovibrio sp.]